MRDIDFSRLEAYDLIDRQPIETLGSVGFLLCHKKTKAKVVVLLNDDNNKVFNIAFRTPCKDDTGVPHIIEHSVLCGSKKYPVKDPFVELAKGSLNTYLNATTYTAKTMYPLASVNDADFKNIMDVYLDAVFSPNIYSHKEIFMQEGWSYKLENVDDDLKISGVVYNEMKGAFSSPERVVYAAVKKAMNPDNQFVYESGGDPENIPDLTYEEFLNFHKKYYHPSNSIIFLYGGDTVNICFIGRGKLFFCKLNFFLRKISVFHHLLLMHDFIICGLEIFKFYAAAYNHNFFQSIHGASHIIAEAKLFTHIVKKLTYRTASEYGIIHNSFGIVLSA